MQDLSQTQEGRRFQEARERQVPWGKWCPYLSERRWGSVREDYSPNGTAWEYFSHETRLVHVLTAGMKMVWAVFAMNGKTCAFRPRAMEWL